MYMSVLFACMCSVRMPGVQESQERVLDPVELELEIVLGTKSKSSAEVTNALNH